MKKKHQKLLFVSVLLISLLLLSQLMLSVKAFAVSVPDVSQEVFVYDDTGQLSQTTKDFIISVNQQYEQTNEKPQLAVVFVDSLQELTIEAYANQLFNKWGIGQVNKDNGALLLRIEVGYGLEETLTDSLTKWILKKNRLLLSEGQFDEASVEIMTALAVRVNDYYDLDDETIFTNKGINFADYRQPEEEASFYDEETSNSNFFTENGWFILIFIVITIIQLITGKGGGSGSGRSSGGWSGGSSRSGGRSSFGGGRSGGGGSSSRF